MNFPLLAAKNVMRNKLRTILTILGVSIAILFFVVFRTVLVSWDEAIEYGARDRLATRNKISFVITLPKTYVEKIKAVPGVGAITWFNWFGAKDPNDEYGFFANMATDPETVLTVYDDYKVDPEQVKAWKADRQGAMIGKNLSKKKGWKIGDRVTLAGTIFPGDWSFNIRAIYEGTKKGTDTSQFFFHYAYMNESFPEGSPRRDQVGWIIGKIDDADKGPGVSAAIDKMFEDSDRQTLTQSELALNRSFVGFFSAILMALNIVSFVILAIIALILGNTIAMGVRERTNEYGVLRAIGFRPPHVVMFILGEAATIGILGGAAGVLLANGIINGLLSKVIEEVMASFFPSFYVHTGTTVAAFGLAVGLAVLASIVPAWRASRLSVIDSLRRVG